MVLLVALSLKLKMWILCNDDYEIIDFHPGFYFKFHPRYRLQFASLNKYCPYQIG